MQGLELVETAVIAEVMAEQVTTVKELTLFEYTLDWRFPINCNA
jgi:hypothetical protein